MYIHSVHQRWIVNPTVCRVAGRLRAGCGTGVREPGEGIDELQIGNPTVSRLAGGLKAVAEQGFVEVGDDGALAAVFQAGPGASGIAAGIEHVLEALGHVARAFGHQVGEDQNH